MPTHAAEQREDRVVALVIADLVQSGRSAALLDRPDRNPNRVDGLTVDAELEVDGERWATDVTTLRWRKDLERAVDKLAAKLQGEFGAQLDAAHLTLVVTCHVSTDENVIGSLVELARQAIVSGQTLERGDESAALWPRSSELGAVWIQPWLGQSAELRLEVATSSGESIGKKLKGQLFRERVSVTGHVSL